MAQNRPEDQRPSEGRIRQTAENDLAAIIRWIFKRPIAFHRSLVSLTGSVTAALMLGQACYWDERTDDPEGWFWKTRDEWEDETGLTRWEQEAARRKLREHGFLQEKLAGVPARMYYRVDFEAIAQAYRKSSHQPVGGKTSNKKEAKPPTGRRKNLKHYKGATEITPKTTTKTTAQNAVRKEAQAGSPHKNEDEQEQHYRFEERRRLLLTQAEQLLKAEQSAK